MRNSVNTARDGDSTILRSGSIEPLLCGKLPLLNVGISHNVHDTVSDCHPTWYITLLEFFPQHQEDSAKLLVLDDIDRLKGSIEYHTCHHSGKDGAHT